MIDFIKTLNPKRFDKPNHQKIFRFIAEVFEIVNNDVKQTVFNFFPYLATPDFVEKHRKSFGIYRYQIDTDENIRENVTKAFDTLQYIGTKSGLYRYLEVYFKDRYSLVFYPHHILDRGFILNITGLLMEEKAKLAEFLNHFLDPDIYFIINNYIPDFTYFKVGYSKIGYSKIGDPNYEQA
jgi:hypothetical protein